MLKKSLVSIITSLLFVSTALADTDVSVKIQPIGNTGISISDIALVSSDWAKGNLEATRHMMGHYVPGAAQAILEAAPELINNKRVLVSLTIGLVMLSQEESTVDTSNALMNISTHKHLVSKPTLTVDEVVNALTSISI